MQNEGPKMDVTKIVAEIDAKIASLQRAREVLLDLNLGEVETAPKRRGRPKGSKNAKSAPKAAKKKRNLTPEGRTRIAEAMKRRWAERRKDVKK
jgi:hypothetical protein